jgi:G-patch domain
MSDDEYEIPLQDQRVFGAGLKRKRVHFVPSSISTAVSSPPPTPAGTSSVAERYLNLVLPKSSSAEPEMTDSLANVPRSNESSSDDSSCDICALPIPSRSVLPSKPHEVTLAHQVCLTHSHPPSHINRSRLGLRLLQSSGWDPDSRTGLGANGQGIQFPIKSKVKEDKLGLGLVLPDKNSMVRKAKVEKLDAGGVRKEVERDKRRGERLREMFYRNEDVERYLGSV